MAKTRKSPTTSKSRKVTKKTISKKRSAKSKSRKRPVQAKPKKAPAESPKSMRLIFSYDGDDVKLISQQPVQMMAPPSDPVKGYDKRKGFWAELKSDRDKTLYRQVMHNPTRNDAEVFSDDPDEGISREPAPKRKGVFVVVVPDSDKGREVTLSRSAPDRKGPARGIRALASKPATEILRFKLKK
jgi:hypothetical protein